MPSNLTATSNPGANRHFVQIESLAKSYPGNAEAVSAA